VTGPLLTLLAFCAGGWSAPRPASAPPADPGAPPLTWATLAADGRYRVVVEPDVEWASFEVKVGSDDAVDLGPARPGRPVELRGWADTGDTLTLRIQAATPKGRGVTYEYEVVVKPTLIEPPRLLDGGQLPSRRGLRGWLRRVFRGA
jgi:hypothetical protein